jgi:hypothetical protein
MFMKKALAKADNRAPHVFARDGLRSQTSPAKRVA